MRAEQEQQDGYYEQELLRRRVLVPIVNLLPHIQVVVGAGVEFEGHALHPVEHKVRAEHVGDVCERPGGFLRDAGDGVEEDLEGKNEDYVYCPCTWIETSLAKLYTIFKLPLGKNWGTSDVEKGR